MRSGILLLRRVVMDRRLESTEGKRRRGFIHDENLDKLYLYLQSKSLQSLSKSLQFYRVNHYSLIV